MRTPTTARTTFLTAVPGGPENTPTELAARIEARLAEAALELDTLRAEVAALAALASTPTVDEPTIAPRLLTVPQAAAVLGVGQSTVHNLIRTAELGSRKLGGSRRIPVEALDAFIARLPAPGIGA